MLWTFDRNTQKMLKYDLEGHLLYAWGTVGDFPGTLWGVHGISVDQEGNMYVAEVDAGRVQKFRPRPGANPGVPNQQADLLGLAVVPVVRLFRGVPFRTTMLAATMCRGGGRRVCVWGARRPRLERRRHPGDALESRRRERRVPARDGAAPVPHHGRGPSSSRTSRAAAAPRRCRSSPRRGRTAGCSTRRRRRSCTRRC